jgi:DHA1 family multidrug resistance protein-like MFS transporter
VRDSVHTTLVLKREEIRRLLSGAVLRVALVIGMAELGFATVIPLLPLYLTERLHASVKLVGLVASTFAIVETVFKITWGSVADRVGRRPLIIGGLLLSSLAPLLMSLLRAPWLFVPLRLLDGLGSAALWPSAAAIMVDLTPSQSRARVMGLLNMFFLTGLALGPALGLYVAGFAGSYKAGFYIASALLLVSALTAWWTLSEVPPSTGGEGNVPVRLVRNREGISSPFLFLLLIAFVQMFAAGLLAPILAIYAKRIMGLSEQAIGTLFLFLVLSVGLASLPAGWLADRVGKRRIVFLGMLLASAGMWQFVLPPKVERLAIAAVALGASYALASPAWLALVSQAAPPGRTGLAMGASETVQGLGLVLGPLLGGLLWDGFGYHAPFAASAALLTVGLILSAVVLLRVPGPPAGPPGRRRGSGTPR